MKPPPSPGPDVNDASCREKTGRALGQWYALLDGLGGAPKGRRELVHALLGGQKFDEWWSTTIVVEHERARGVHEKDGRPKGDSICSTKTIRAPLERVFAAFGVRAGLARWFGPDPRVDFAKGGTLTTGDGDRLRFTRIRAGKDLRLAWEHPTRAPGSQVEVLFTGKGKGKTGLILNHTRMATRRDADELRAGWSTAFEALEQHLEAT
jgi:uncharacterized protein YndB with AHSA1/START domain